MEPLIRVSQWFKVLMYVAAFVPGASIWLVGRIHRLNSIVLSKKGLEQSFLSFRGALHVRLEWDQVARVSFSGMSFHFTGVNGEHLELNTSAFNDMQQTIRTVRDRLPSRLRSQLDQ